MTKPALETRLPCPVCLGVMMRKTRVSGGGADVTLDSCGRCGGIWFELGEVQRLRMHPSDALWSRLQRRNAPFMAQCHRCHAMMDRQAERCTACDAANIIDCPTCRRPLSLEVHDGLRLDLCRHCKGIWFDHSELDAVWQISLSARRDVRGATAGADLGAWLLLDSLTYSPDLLFYGARAAGMAVHGGAELLGNAPDLAVGAVEVAGEAASGVFEVIVEIIGGIFS
jgi:Zn-finger nucleic acid-binding protein